MPPVLRPNTSSGRRKELADELKNRIEQRHSIDSITDIIKQGAPVNYVYRVSDVCWPQATHSNAGIFVATDDVNMIYSYAQALKNH